MRASSLSAHAGAVCVTGHVLLWHVALPVVFVHLCLCVYLSQATKEEQGGARAFKERRHPRRRPRGRSRAATEKGAVAVQQQCTERGLCSQHGLGLRA